MAARLIVVAGSLPRTELVLSEAESLIGRDPAADILLSSLAASRRHCLVLRSGDQYLVRDLGSHNGTLVNGVPVTERVLQNGDRITVSDSVFTFVRDGWEPSIRPEVTESPDHNEVEFASVELAETLYRNPRRLLADAETEKVENGLRALLEINRKAAGRAGRGLPAYASGKSGRVVV
jgi:pSer/pThr/pTyr-binding forkhead associated (FHA) protein